MCVKVTTYGDQLCAPRGKPAVADGLTMTSADITIPYDARRLNGFDPANLRIYYLDETYGLWVPASDQQSVDAVAQTVTARVSHFSTYTVMAIPDEGGGFESYWDTKPSWCLPRGEGPGEQLDVAFSIDQPGSMETNDPDGMRVDGAKLFVDAMRPADRAAVVGFADFHRTYAWPTSLDSTASRSPSSAPAGRYRNLPSCSHRCTPAWRNSSSKSEVAITGCPFWATASHPEGCGMPCRASKLTAKFGRLFGHVFSWIRHNEKRGARPRLTGR
jgi:hypothetical protein